jgi:hypothetical protein
MFKNETKEKKIFIEIYRISTTTLHNGTRMPRCLIFNYKIISWIKREGERGRQEGDLYFYLLFIHSHKKSSYAGKRRDVDPCAVLVGWRKRKVAPPPFLLPSP